MLTKILLTVAVAVAAMLYLRSKAGDTEPPRSRQSEAERRTLQQGRNLATLVIVVLLLGIGGSVFYYKWQQENRLIEVRVVNSTSNRVTTYRIFATTLQGRTFVTEDGRTITLADVERLEVLDPDN